MPLVKCPGCGGQLRVTSLDRRVRCPRPQCRTVFVPAQVQEGATAQPAAASPTEEPLGQTAASTGPGDPFSLDALSDELLAGAQPIGPVEQMPGVPAAAPPPRRSAKQKQTSNLGIIAAIAGGAVAVLALIAILVFVLISGGGSSGGSGLAASTPPQQPAPQPQPKPAPPTQTAPPQHAPPQRQPVAQATPAAQQRPSRPVRDLSAFIAKDAEGFVRIAVARLPQNAVWYEELIATIRPVTAQVDRSVAPVSELLVIRKGDEIVYVFRFAQAVDESRFVRSWRLQRAADVSGIPLYTVTTSPYRIAFPDPTTLLVGSEQLARTVLGQVTSAAEPAIHPLLAQAGLKQGNEAPLVAVVPTNWMRGQLTKALTFVAEEQHEELLDAMQRPHTTALIFSPQGNQGAANIDLFFECESKGQADVFAQWMRGLPDFARRLQEAVSGRRRQQPQPPGPQGEGDAEQAQIPSDPGRHRRSQIAGAVAAMAGIWREAKVSENGAVVLVRTPVPTSEDWLTNRVELVTATISAVLGTDAVGTWPYAGPLIRLNGGIAGFLAEHNRTFPQGAIPNKAAKGFHFLRMSWLVHILPYIGRQQLYDSLDLKGSWTTSTNVRAALTVVDEFLDPRVPVRRGEVQPYLGLALTHFVGMGGVGYDAPTLPPDHPRAGVFGYDRKTRVADIKDGAGQTIMLIQVYDIYGPWVAGGGATIRSAQRPPYIGVSGAFGSPGDPPGVFVLMADGSARYLAKDIDPRVFEALCTIAGSEKVTLEQQTSLPNGVPVLTGKTGKRTEQ